jgi:DNA polymerase I-like protein with 3'-5' exonuclease and polymerase domains
VLEFAGYPTTAVVIDFEMYFDTKADYGLKTLSTVEYLTDPRSEVLGLASLISDERGQDLAWHNGEEAVATFLKHLQATYGDDLAGITVINHNSQFDCSVLAFKFGIHPKYIIDTLGLSRAWDSRRRHGLEFLAKDYDLGVKGETANFDGWSNRPRVTRSKPEAKRRKPPERRAPMTAEQQKLLGQYATNDAVLEFKLLQLMLPRLSRPEVELPLCQHCIEMTTLPTLVVDYDKAASIVTRMQEKVTEAVSATGETAKDLTADLAFDRLLTQALEDAQDQPQKYMKVMSKGWAYALAKPDEARGLLMNHPSERVRQLMAGRIAADSWPVHVKRVNAIVDMAKADGGRLPACLNYHAAHTGRYSGGGGINLQNMGARGDALVSEIREIITAPPGHKLVVVDLAGIEARVSAWLCGQDDLIAGFAENRDVYCEFGTQFFGVPVRKPRPDGIAAIEKRMKERRNLSKVAVLACSYGMGPGRFQEYSGCDAETAASVVKAYREMYPAIPKFWYAAEKAFVYTAKYKQPGELPNGLRLDYQPDVDVQVTLPSGHTMQYHKVKLESDGRNDRASVWNDLNKTWEPIWGGAILENWTQATSRHILVESMMRLEAQDIHTALSVHDELVIVAPTEKADEVLATTIKEMTVTPSWATNLPLAAEGFVTDHYGK